MNDVERLKSYYSFDDDVLGMVQGAIDRQSGYSFKELAEKYGISSGPEHSYISEKPIELVTFRPQTDYDERFARVLHGPHGMTTWSMVTRAMRLFEADSSSQLILLGNPSFIGNHYNLLTLKESAKVWTGDLSPTVEPHLRYLESIGVNRAHQIGFSWGADKAAEASGSSAIEHGIEVTKGIFMEPVSVVDRGMLKLGLDFQRAGAELKRYQTASDMPKVDDKVNSSFEDILDFVRWFGGLSRASNLAITHVLAHRNFSDRAIRALSSQPELKATVTVAWGTQSELLPGPEILKEVEAIKSARYNYASRVGTMLLEGMHHAGGDDIDLHTAIVLESSRL